MNAACGGDGSIVSKAPGILGGQSFGDLTTRWAHTNHGVRAGKWTTVNVPTAGPIDSTST